MSEAIAPGLQTMNLESIQEDDHRKTFAVAWSQPIFPAVRPLTDRLPVGP